jgi:hypothetical protein
MAVFLEVWYAHHCWYGEGFQEVWHRKDIEIVPEFSLLSYEL